MRMRKNFETFFHSHMPCSNIDVIKTTTFKEQNSVSFSFLNHAFWHRFLAKDYITIKAISESFFS